MEYCLKLCVFGASRFTQMAIKILAFVPTLCFLPPLGVGVASVVLSFIVSIYYNLIITWSLYYFFNSFRDPLPWDGCNKTWNTENCSSYFTGSNDSTTASQEFFRYNSQHDREVVINVEERNEKQSTQSMQLDKLTNGWTVWTNNNHWFSCIFQ